MSILCLTRLFLMPILANIRSYSNQTNLTCENTAKCQCIEWPCAIGWHFPIHCLSFSHSLILSLSHSHCLEFSPFLDMDHCLLFYFSILYPMVLSDVYNGDMRIWLDLTRLSGPFWPGEWNELDAKCIFHLHSSVSLVPHLDMAHFWPLFTMLLFYALFNDAIVMDGMMKTQFHLFFDFLTRWIKRIKCKMRNACPRSSTRLFFSFLYFFILLPWRPLSSYDHGGCSPECDGC